MSRFYALGVLVLACATERQPNVTDEERGGGDEGDGGRRPRPRARAAGATTTVGEVDSNFNKRKAISIWCLGWRAVISFRADRSTGLYNAIRADPAVMRQARS